MAPELVFVEVISLVRKALARRRISPSRAAAAMNGLVTLEIETVGHRRHTARVWELRENVSPYDAAYVAVAEDHGLLLLTADKRLSRASGPRCPIELIG